jgi:hypothetical protein
MKVRFVIHPLLFALFPVLFLLDHNKGLLLINEELIDVVLLTLTLAAYGGYLLWRLLNVLLSDKEKAGLFVSLSLVLFFSYGHCRNVIGNVDFVVGRIQVGPDKILFVIFGMLFLLATYFFLKTESKLERLTSVLNIVACTLVTSSLISIGAHATKLWIDHQQSKSPGTVQTYEVESSKPDLLPDIYYIILDRYANGNTLKSFYGFDNTEFIEYLSGRGFYVASQSSSNYLQTAHSLASSLNMEFVNYLSQTPGEESNDWTPLYSKLQDHKVWRFLKSKGYRFIHMGSWWDPTRMNPYADLNINKFRLPEFAVTLLRSTMAYPLLLNAHLHLLDPDIRQGQRERVPYIFDRLAEIPKLKEPTFVFAHILIPHLPYVFDRDGKFLSEEEVNRRSRKLNYVDQLIFANKKTRIVIDRLLSASSVPPIILLQGDEGPWPVNYERNEETFDWTQATEAEIKEKMGILNAYFLPGVDKSVLYPSITPVNSFRLVFNLYFGEHFELLPDENFAFVDRSHIYKFFSVKGKLR